jgi:phosphatidate phosphatase LPIN
MSPDGAFTSFTREVIYKKPEIFKIAVLREIKQLFSISSPFYAGFGNRDTDALAYKAVGVNLNRIYLINPEGKVYGINNTYNKNYSILNEMVHSMFPYFSKEE